MTASATCPCFGRGVSGGVSNPTGLLRRPALALGAWSLAGFRSYWAAPATCPCFGRGVSGGVWPLLDCSGDLPFCVEREVSGGVWPLLCAGPSPRLFCAGVRLCSGPALTTRGRHTQRLVCPTWARDRVGDRPLLSRAHDLRMLALTLRWAETGPPGHFCAGPGSPCFCPYSALGLDFGTCSSAGVSGPGSFLESRPSLHWARDV